MRDDMKPWQIRRAEYLAEASRERAENQPRLQGAALEREMALIADGHRTSIVRRLEAGLPIPPEVVADYPELLRQNWPNVKVRA